MDGFQDCFQGDDEENANISCFLPDAKYRYRCSNEPNKCISPMQLQDRITDCQFADDEINPIEITVRDYVMDMSISNLFKVRTISKRTKLIVKNGLVIISIHVVIDFGIVKMG